MENTDLEGSHNLEDKPLPLYEGRGERLMPSKKQRIWLDSLNIQIKRRICPRCKHEWQPFRLSAYHCSRCRKEIGLSEQALQYIEAFKENGERMDLPILDDKTREGLIEEAVKGVSDIVGKKVDERLGSALGNIAGIFLRKFTPFIEDRIGNIDFGDFKIPNLDRPQEVNQMKIAGCTPEEEAKYRKLFGWETGYSSRDVPLEKRVTTPLKPTPTPQTAPTVKKETPAPQEEVAPLSQEQQYENYLVGFLSKVTVEELEGYLNMQGLEFGLRPHIEKLDEEAKRFIIENLSIDLVYSFLEQNRPDLLPLLKTEKGIKWSTKLINGVRHFCKTEPQEEEKEGDENTGKTTA